MTTQKPCICLHYLTQPLRGINRAIANAIASRRELALLQADRVNIHLTTRTKSNSQTTSQEN